MSMEHKIGSKFEYHGVKLKVVRASDDYCTGCYFYKNESSCSYSVRDVIGPCGSFKRSDLQSVIFKQVKTRSATKRKRS